MRFRVWDQSAGEARQDAISVEAVHAEDAAEAFAERCFNQGDPFTSIVVGVTIEGSFEDSAAETFEVEVEAVPSFTARKKS